MGRSPAMFVRPVTMTEGQHLQRIGRTAVAGRGRHSSPLPPACPAGGVDH